MWCIFLRILLLGGPYPPSQLVPYPFNWSENTVFCRYLRNGRSNQKIKKLGAFSLLNCLWKYKRCSSFLQILLLGVSVTYNSVLKYFFLLQLT